VIIGVARFLKCRSTGPQRQLFGSNVPFNDPEREGVNRMGTCDGRLADVDHQAVSAAVLDALPTVVLVLSVEGETPRCVMANRAFAARYGVEDDVSGRPPDSVLAPATAALLEAAAGRALHTGEPLTYTDVAGVGSPTLDATVAPLPGFPGLVAWTAVERAEPPSEGSTMAVLVEESTRLGEANAELSRSNADLADFAYVASHDLTEPLRMVASHLDFVRSRCAESLDDQAMRSIDFAVEGAARMRALVDALLELAQVTTQPVQPVPVPLDRIVADALADLEGAIEEAGAQVVVGELPVVHADRKTLTTVFANVVGNAVKFRSEKPPRIEIRASRTEDAWLVEVLDNGIGIPPEHRSQVFEMFRRLQPRSQHPGTGMGLAICRRVVERHGGRIMVDANDGGGSAFRFTLPIRETT
jgi:signal transduction histidine kinase